MLNKLHYALHLHPDIKLYPVEFETRLKQGSHSALCRKHIQVFISLIEKTESVRCNAVLGSTFALNEKYFAPLGEADVRSRDRRIN
ncbi:MAG: hypothetical protein HC936_10950 [Leptolyngbyaceae cyanobacterium SU_3_3]|nr:hypothetical protein [Leptolyngbyaceae cyanobacterium SU_3_3]